MAVSRSMKTDATLTTSFGGRHMSVSGWVRDIRWTHAVNEPVTVEVAFIVGHVEEEMTEFIQPDGDIGAVMRDPNQTLDALEWLASRIEEVTAAARL